MKKIFRTNFAKVSQRKYSKQFIIFKCLQSLFHSYFHKKSFSLLQVFLWRSNPGVILKDAFEENSIVNDEMHIVPDVFVKHSEIVHFKPKV